jgi:hypothetical protein
MGRGLGQLQREILRLVDESFGPDGERAWAIADLAARIFGDGYADTQRRSVARAVQGLATRGHVELFRSARWRRPDGLPVPETFMISAKRIAEMRAEREDAFLAAVMEYGASKS